MTGTAGPGVGSEELPPVTLHTTALSANGRKPLLLVHHLDLPVVVHSVNVYAGEGQTTAYRTLNPQGKVPTLVDGDLVLTESNAILIYLCEAHGGDRLWSRQPVTRARIGRWLFWEAAHWQPSLLPVLEAAVASLLIPDAARPPPVPPDWDEAGFLRQLGHLEAHLTCHPWLVGDDLTIADLSVAGMAMYLRRCDFPFERTPGLAAWLGRIEALDAWKATAVAPFA